MFDEELAVRISQNTLRIPSLDERPADVKMLATRFVEKYAVIYEKTCTLERDALNFLCTRHWPGNTNQIEKTMERAVKSAQMETITMSWLKGLLESAPEVNAGPVESLETLEKQQILRALKVHGSRDNAARMLGIGRATLYRKLKQYNISAPY